MTAAASRFERRLGALPCFAGLRHRDLAVVAGLVDEIDVAAGRRFGGRPGQEVMIIKEGAAIEVGAVPVLLGPGAVVGPNGAGALTGVRLLVIGRRALPTLLERAPRLAQALRERSEFTGLPLRAHRTAVVATPSRPRAAKPAAREPS